MPKQETVVETVKMDDGRVVEFAGKKRLIKESFGMTGTSWTEGRSPHSHQAKTRTSCPRTAERAESSNNLGQTRTTVH